MTRVGIAFAEQPSTVQQVISASRRAEAAGFESVWMAQDLWTRRDGLTFLSCLALMTDRVHVGSSVLNPYSYHPMQIAMILNTLADLAPRRLRLGIGSGLPWWTPLFPERVQHEPPLGLVRKTIQDVRALLAGDEVVYGEETFSLAVARPCWENAIPPLDFPVPIYLGAKGPKMTELAGEIADGLIFGTGTRPDEVRGQLASLATGAKRGGRKSSDIDVAEIIITSVSGDGSFDANTVGAIAGRIARLSENEIELLRLDADTVRRIRDAFRVGDCEAAGSLMSREMMSIWAAVGTPDECLDMLHRHIENGVSLPILFTYGSDIEALVDLGALLVKQPNS